MKPIPFFLGLIIGISSLSIAGWTIQNTPLAQNFVRFHAYNNAEAGFLTTAAELATIIDQQPPSRAYIIVGGSSVLNGIGQSRDLVWTSTSTEAPRRRFRCPQFCQSCRQFDRLWICGGRDAVAPTSPGHLCRGRQ